MQCRGFTLIELLVVLTIIAVIIGGIGVVAVGGFKKRRDADRIAHMAFIQSTLEFYIAQHDDFTTILSSDGVLTTHNGQTFDEAVYYSTPVYPSAVSGKHPWSTLQGYMSAYAPTLPTDPKNEYDGWLANGEPDYGSEDIRNGYIIVRLRSLNVDQLSGCSGAGHQDEYVAGYIVESVLESEDHKASNRIREPRLFGCISQSSPEAHVMRFWGTVK